MTQTLDRQIVETRKPLPEAPVQPEPRRPVLIRWLPWLVGVAVVVGLMFIALSPGELDESYSIAEMNRFEASRLLTPMASLDSSYDVAEMNRFEATGLLVPSSSPAVLSYFEWASPTPYRPIQQDRAMVLQEAPLSYFEWANPTPYQPVLDEAPMSYFEWASPTPFQPDLEE